MTITEQIAVADECLQLWQILMDIGLPERQQFLMWSGNYPAELVTRGINRAAAKARKMRDVGQPMSTDDAVRYASSVMKNERLGIRKHDRRTH